MCGNNSRLWRSQTFMSSNQKPPAHVTINLSEGILTWLWANAVAWTKISQLRTEAIWCYLLWRGLLLKLLQQWFLHFLLWATITARSEQRRCCPCHIFCRKTPNSISAFLGGIWSQLCDLAMFRKMPGSCLIGIVIIGWILELCW